VKVSNDRGCSSTSPAVMVNVVTAVKPVITRTGSNLTSSIAVTFQWSFNGTPITGATGSSVTATQEGAYTVEITDTNGCTATSDPFNYTLSSVPGSVSAGDLAIYPHPNTGIFTVSVRLPHAGDVSMTVVDAAGRQVASFNDRASGADYSRRVDIEKEPAGVYFVRLESDGHQWVKEVVKR
jgi:hypothetical protein